MSPRILIAEDEAISLKHLTYALEKEGYEVTGTKDGISAFSLFEKNAYDVIIADIKMPGMDGLTLLEKIKAKESDAEVIIITGFGSIESAITAMK
jgi:DNA-binding NtrC family response regulator